MRIATRVKLTKPFKLGPNAHQGMETFVRRLFQRECREVMSIVLSIESRAASDPRPIACQIMLTLRTGGFVTVSDFGDTISAAVLQASLRARQVVRRRLHKRRSLVRRSGNRFDTSLTELCA